MTARQVPSSRKTLTGSQSSPRKGREGVVTGHLFKMTRERAGLTQQGLAEALEVDTTTVQGWESGRRPLTALPMARFRALGRDLLRRGADPSLLALFDVALDADAVLSHALRDDPARDLVGHPLAGWVFTRTATHMIVWALNGVTPAALPVSPSNTSRRRGPVPTGSLLGASDRRQFFGHLRRYAEEADRAGEGGALLRRQALYLCSYDAEPGTHEWIAHMRARQPATPRPGAWTWADARSLATSLTRYGDRDALHAFIERSMADDAGELANLNYWAYWLGLDQLPRGDDSFMGRHAGWDAGALLRNLVDRLHPELGCIDLNVHSVWALLTARPGVLSTDPRIVCDLRERVSHLLDSDTVSSQSRRELDAVHYGLRLTSL
ncbi:helix-turn-helix domain-containing protein [Streptomyces sp. NPDC005438]|uniref:helix-turn-helix domain-containing protein n=1 Tax=Streptomyces sp. NPDC005438 TaxID=3156880 RepID=UPI0033AAB431